MKTIICIHCSQETKLHSEKFKGVEFFYKYQVCLNCRNAFKINSEYKIQEELK